jgi:hypothetical protein
MRCHLIMPIWFNLFQIDSSILTIQNSYALQWRSLRIAVNDLHRVLTDELVCTPPLNGRVDHCELQCLALFTSVADMYQVKRLNMHCASKMWDMASEETVTSFLRWAIQANCTQRQEKCMSLLE